MAALDDERLKSDIAQQIYDLRTAAHLSQRALAARVGTTASVIGRLEDTDYQSHSVSILRRIARVFGCRVIRPDSGLTSPRLRPMICTKRT